MILATTTLAEVVDCVWDVVVVGAGPAGSVAALGLARRGLKVLLVDRCQFPRPKLCGACLSSAGLRALEELGLCERLAGLGGVPLHEFHMRFRRKGLSLPLPEGLSVTRTQLDALLVNVAVESGADFLPGVSLQLEPAAADAPVRRLSAGQRSDATSLQARVIILATGLGGQAGDPDPRLSVMIKHASRIGVGTTSTRFPAEFRPGVIYMAIGRSGYVGVTRTEGEELNLAAALDRRAVQQETPRGACEQVLREAGFPMTPDMLSGEWRGTTGLTRQRRHAASTRVFVVGDAAGYVEPFTGEGMTWALRSAQAVVPLAARAVTEWNRTLGDEWSHAIHEVVGRQQVWCRAVARLLRHPVLVRGGLSLLSVRPSLGEFVVNRIHGRH